MTVVNDLFDRRLYVGDWVIFNRGIPGLVIGQVDKIVSKNTVSIRIISRSSYWIHSQRCIFLGEDYVHKRLTI